MKAFFLLVVLFLISIQVKSQCEVTSGNDIEIACGDTAHLSVTPFLELLYSNPDTYLLSIYFIDNMHGFAGGMNGKILKTTDGGLTWEEKTFFASENWVNFTFTDINTGYAISSSSAKIIKTNDGGNTWNIVYSSAQSYHFNQISFADDNHLFVIGNGGVILKTANAGQTWTIVTSGVTFNLTDICFISDQKGFIVGNDNLFTTLDGGQTWTVTTPYPSPLNSIFFVDQNVGYIAGMCDLLLKTEDGGITWTKMSGYLQKSYVGFYDVEFINDSTGYACGTNYQLYKTNNGGISWEFFSSNPFSYQQYFEMLDCTEPGTVLLVGSGKIYAHYEPVSYSWEPASGLNSTSVPKPLATPTQTTTYIASVTDKLGCIATDTVTVFVERSSFVPEICMVTVDSESDHHKIIWEKQNFPAFDSVYIYKEGNETGQFNKIGVLVSDQPGEFIDQESNSQIQSNRYEISVLDPCRFESNKSQPHKTMHLSINQGMGNTWNLIWESYEGFDVNSYNIYRGPNPEAMEIIASLPSSSTQFTDLQAPDGSVYYRIGAECISPCNPQKSYTSSVSNLASYIKQNTSVPEICYVTVDPEVYENKIVWTKIELASIDSIIIYKETTSPGVFIRLAEVANNATSAFVDTSSQPLNNSCTYKLSSVDNTKLESEAGNKHSTIYLSINKMTSSCNLNWNEYTGFTVNEYNIYRGSEPGNMQKIAILSGGNSQYTDLQVPDGSVYYQIEAVNSEACNPVESSRKSISNIASHIVYGIDETKNASLTISPCPVIGSFKIITKDISAKYHLLIYNSVGIIEKESDFFPQQTIDISDLKPGLYFLQLTNETYTSTTKLIKQ